MMQALQQSVLSKKQVRSQGATAAAATGAPGVHLPPLVTHEGAVFPLQGGHICAKSSARIWASSPALCSDISQA